MNRSHKPFEGKLYPKIPHLIGSRTGPADKTVNRGQHRICTTDSRDYHITVLEKLDGSCCAVGKKDGNIYPLIRAGYLAMNSYYPMHWDFADWVYSRFDLFNQILQEGDRIVGEWMQEAHGTIYDLPHEPFVPFDYFQQDRRMPFSFLLEKTKRIELPTPHILHRGKECSIKEAMESLGSHGHHGAVDEAEGAVWRVEKKDKVKFLAKFVRHNKVDGCYLSNKEPTYNLHNGLSLEYLRKKRERRNDQERSI